MNDATIEYEYFMWLSSFVTPPSDVVIKHNKTYLYLLDYLHRTPFRWHVPNDDNRASDGCQLRDMFADYNGSWGGSQFIWEPCTVLEMLIALSRRADYETSSNDEDCVNMWFWIMLSNVGLTVYSDDIYYPRVLDKIEFILDRLMDRTYDRNGYGGLFPMKGNVSDQTKSELWDQLNEYINQNFDLV